MAGKRVALALILAIFAGTALAEEGVKTSGLNTALANALYCQLAGCTMSGGILVGRLKTTGFAPTCSVTGAGTGGTCTVDTGSSDDAGLIQINTGTTPAANGTVVVTFSTGSAYGANTPSCLGMLQGGTATWNARATVIGASGGMLATSATFNWDNNAVTLTASTSNGYRFMYHCISK